MSAFGRFQLWPHDPHTARHAADQGELDRLSADWERRAQLAFKSPHWAEPNVVAHARFNTRTVESGARVLFLEEIQSDWHQDGRRFGYQREEQLLRRDNARRAFDEIAPTARTILNRHYAPQELAALPNSIRRASAWHSRVTDPSERAVAQVS